MDEKKELKPPIFRESALKSSESKDIIQINSTKRFENFL